MTNPKKWDAIKEGDQVSIPFPHPQALIDIEFRNKLDYRPGVVKSVRKGSVIVGLDGGSTMELDSLKHIFVEEQDKRSKTFSHPFSY